VQARTIAALFSPARPSPAGRAAIVLVIDFRPRGERRRRSPSPSGTPSHHAPRLIDESAGSRVGGIAGDRQRGAVSCLLTAACSRRLQSDHRADSGEPDPARLGGQLASAGGYLANRHQRECHERLAGPRS
jgi:hypothetical protein